MEWINDGKYFCSICDIKFKVYAEDNEPTVNFCPMCASREIEFIDDEE